MEHTLINRTEIPILGNITIRTLNSINDYQLCENLQKEIWGDKDIVRVPLLDLITANHNGGIVLGAFNEVKKLVGFIYSFPGLTNSGHLKLCSVVLGVSHEYRSQGLGYQLKIAQKNEAQKRGFDLITWTFDPLLSLNAYLNINKLQTTSSVYFENYYGNAQGLNKGLETDRILVEWKLQDFEPNQIKEKSQIIPSPVITTEFENDWLIPKEYKLSNQEQVISVEIPGNIQQMKNSDLVLAQEWRVLIKEVLSNYFKKGYQITDFQTLDVQEKRFFYILERV